MCKQQSGSRDYQVYCIISMHKTHHKPNAITHLSNCNYLQTINQLLQIYILHMSYLCLGVTYIHYNLSLQCKTEISVTWSLQNKTTISALHFYSTYCCLVLEGPCDI